MKYIYKYLTLVVVLFIGLIASCDSDETNGSIGYESIDLVLDNENVEVLVGGTTTINILEGGGDYKIISLNPDIANVSIENNSITIEGHVLGVANVIISDKASNYKNLPINVYYDQLILENSTYELSYKLGQSPKPGTVLILQGNGGYTATSDNEDITVSISNENEIRIFPIKDGEAKITITDARGLSEIINVSVFETDVPFTDFEIEQISQLNEITFVINEIEYKQSAYPYMTIYNQIQGEKQINGFYIDWYFYKLTYQGDNSVGKKEDAIFDHYYYPNPSHSNQPVEFEIIKNDGEKLWAVFSFIKYGVLNTGYFIQTIQ